MGDPVLTVASRGSFGRAFRWSVVSNASRQGVTTLVTFALAAVLSPEDFGVASLALLFAMLVQALLQQGLMPALLSRRPLTHDSLVAAHWLLVAVSLLAVGALQCLAGVVSQGVGSPELEPALRVLSSLLLLDALALPYEAELRSRLDLKPLALRAVLSASLGGGVGVFLAFTGHGFWSIVAQQVTTSAVGLLVIAAASRWRPRLALPWEEVKGLLPYSARSGVGALGQFLNARVDVLLVGLFLGPLFAGLYRLAGRVVEAVLEVTSRSLVGIALPELMRDEHPSLARVRRVLARNILVTAPVLGLIAGLAPALLGVLGREWVLAAPALVLLCVGGVASSAASGAAPVLQAHHRPGVLARLSWTGAGIGLVVCLSVGLALELLGREHALLAFAAARVLTQLTNLVIAYRVLCTSLEAPLRALVPLSTLAPVLVGALAAAAGWAAISGLDARPPSVQLLAGVTAGLAVLVGFCLATERGRHLLFRGRLRTGGAQRQKKARPSAATAEPVSPSGGEDRASRGADTVVIG